MKIEKKLIACSILALIIGVSSVLPLTFLMSATAKAEPTSEPWFSVNMPYAYWTAYDGPLKYPEDYPFEQPEPNEEEYSVSNQRMMYLNITLDEISTTEPFDARVEYYQMNISSDVEHIMDMNYFVGIYDNSSSFSFHDFLQDFHFRLGDWFDTAEFDNSTGEGNGMPNTTGGGNGVMSPNWTVGVSKLLPEGGSGCYSTTYLPDGQNVTTPLVSALREAETLFITIRRIGWVTFAGNSTVVTLANNEIVDQIQLDKLGEATFLYNDLVPEEELTDLLRPLKSN